MLLTKDKNRACSLLFLFTILLYNLSLPAANARGSELVTCKYLASSGKRIELQIGVASPPPATLIVTQRLPRGTSVIGSSPKVKKINAKQGIVKWLLKRVQPGSFVLSLTLDQPLAPGMISGELQYKNPLTGVMVRMPIMP